MSRARRGALVLICALLVGACGGGGGPSATTRTTSASTTTATTAEHTAAGTTATTRASGTKPRPVTVPTRSPTTAQTGDAVADAAAGGVGDLAGPLLGPGPVTRVVYELLVQEGLDPHEHTVDHVVGQLRRFAGRKTVVVERTALPAGPSRWDEDALHDYADRYARFRSAGNTAALHVLFVRGGMPDASGVATRADVMAVFPDSFAGGGLTASEAQIEDVVVMHETGHLLGLVDLWLATGRGDTRDDPAPGGHHSSNPDSVMYWRVDTIDVASFFRGGPPSEFDAADARDLFAIRDGAPRGSRG